MLQKKATPTRHFTLVDQSAQFEEVILSALERSHQRRVLQALQQYAMTHARQAAGEGASAPDLEQLPPPDRAAELLDEFAESNPEALEAFAREGGAQQVLERLRPLLRDDAPPFEEPRRRYQLVPLAEQLDPGADLAVLGQELKPYLRGNRKIRLDGDSVTLYAAVLIPPDLTNHIVRPTRGMPELQPGQGVQYWSVNLADLDLRNDVERAINEEIRRREYAGRGLDPDSIREIERTRAPFASLNPRKEEGKEQVSMADYIRQWAPSGFVYLLWVAIFTISQMLLSSTIEEKSNRIIEVLLSSVTPGELMTGKLIGIAGVGLTMIGAWIGALIGLLALAAGPETEFAMRFIEVLKTSNLLPAFAFYFLFGYLMYAALIMALGSLCNTLKEAQNFMGVVTIILIVPLFTMAFIPRDPNGTLATVLSWIPLYTPFVMMNRATASPPLFDLVGTMILMLASTGLSLWLSAKIFRIGILRTGQPPKLLELLRWLRS
jgi:ABC-2 type transport system permease protein